MAGFTRTSRLFAAVVLAGSVATLMAQRDIDPRRDFPPLDDQRVAKKDKPVTAKPTATVKSGIVARGVSRPKESKSVTPATTQPNSAPVVAPESALEPTPEQPVILRPQYQPAVAPRISYEGGRLTIIASNSTLGDILAAIRSATGVKIEAPGGGSNERVAAKIGPAPLRSVLLSLLQGARYDYVILGSAEDPERVERVILTPKLAGGAQSVAATTPLRQPEPNQETIESADPEDNTGSPASDENEGFAPAPQAQPQSPSDQPQGQPQPAAPNPNTTTPKTPEQLLEDLKRLELERQQQNQQREQRGERPR